MSWTNVPIKNPGDPVTAENWNGLVGNFPAVAAGDPGAPRVQVPQALATNEINPSLVLHPDGSGGVAWGTPASAYQFARGVSNVVGLDILSGGSWLVWAVGSQTFDQYDYSGYSGQCVVVNGTIVHQATVIDRSPNLQTTQFRISGGRLRFLDLAGNTTVGLMALRVG